MTALIKPQMFWVANRSFGITWVCTQLRVHKYVKASGYAFKKVQDDEEDADEDAEASADEEVVEGSSEEEEEEEEVDAE